mmetsp:Transcript_13861/g.30126  ORF Transcript_13861/g.30126 Transcript_13861/m.30126 type:complete len:249 (-) Transcript_13861:554-1300(-)
MPTQPTPNTTSVDLPRRVRQLQRRMHRHLHPLHRSTTPRHLPVYADGVICEVQGPGRLPLRPTFRIRPPLPPRQPRHSSRMTFPSPTSSPKPTSMAMPRRPGLPMRLPAPEGSTPPDPSRTFTLRPTGRPSMTRAMSSRPTRLTVTTTRRTSIPATLCWNPSAICAAVSYPKIRPAPPPRPSAVPPPPALPPHRLVALPRAGLNTLREKARSRSCTRMPPPRIRSSSYPLTIPTIGVRSAWSSILTKP